MFEYSNYIKLLSFALLLIYSLIVIKYSSTSHEIRNKIKQITGNKSLIINTLIIIIFSIIMLNNSYFIKDTNKSNKFYQATKHAIIAFLIAIFAHLGLRTPVFWLIWMTTYYLT